MNPIVVSNPEILGGVPIFDGTRVPVKNLTDYLDSGSTIEEFLDDFPSVKREQVVYFLGVMEKIKRGEERLRAEGGISQAEMEREFADLTAFARARELDTGNVAPLAQTDVFTKARAALQ